MRNKATKKNMDLDLRRYGKMLYTKAEESGSSDGSGSGGNSNVFFQLASIQPNRYMVTPPDGDTLTLIDIENLDLNAFINYIDDGKEIDFFHSKEEIAKLGFTLGELEALECFTLDNPNPTENNSISVDSSIIGDNFIISRIQPGTGASGLIYIEVRRVTYDDTKRYYIMRYAYGDNNNYVIIAANNIG